MRMLHSTLEVVAIALLTATLSHGCSVRFYKVPRHPVLTAIPHENISRDVRRIEITRHNITSLGPNEFSRYHRLVSLYMFNLPLNDNINPYAFNGTHLTTLHLEEVGLTKVPLAVLSLHRTLYRLNLPSNKITNFKALQCLMDMSHKLSRVMLSHIGLSDLPNLSPQICRNGSRRYTFSCLMVRYWLSITIPIVKTNVR
jgi:hypothetical protein